MTRVLSIRQPWAELIMGGEKTVENRTWRPGGVRRIGVHVSLRDDDTGPSLPTAGEFGRVARAERDRGHVIGTVLVTGFHPFDSLDCACSVEYAQQADGVYHWTLSDPHRFVTPIRAKGALGLWEAGPSLEHLILLEELAHVREVSGGAS